MRVASDSILKRIVFFPLRYFFSGSTRISRRYDSKSLLARYGPYSPRRRSACVGTAGGSGGLFGVTLCIVCAASALAPNRANKIAAKLIPCIFHLPVDMGLLVPHRLDARLRDWEDVSERGNHVGDGVVERNLPVQIR